ncbi:orotidine-5'-phosphate decarboxylase [Rarobacter faecitabidus]|uniref:Orotidine 5'-phosphate decarboxylase n=1 Tax=Rarobacter faecitabidus TaxID=13243 RepID=A0A542ZVP4_RARFA|nr:orotidine-5'-phosphate decarboxylase [Rarobacter faecitabidus]TQL64437.1 orotidine-5'-phosphate decarboxylase [Rarobacter faecitabidus]
MTFGSRLAAAMDARGPLCVGIDPHASLLDAWGLPDTADGVAAFSLAVLRAVGGLVAAVKPQSALFERHGSRGVAVLEEVVATARDLDTLCIVDAKRGDIGSTMAGYADAYLGDSPLAGDAVTLSPFLGFGSLRPAIDQAIAAGRGVFVLALTSNPEGASVQHARNADGVSVAGEIARSAGEINSSFADEPFGPVGLVVGATIGDAAVRLGVDLAGVHGPLLAPGVGSQGAGPAELQSVFGEARRAVLASSSRGILRAGPNESSLRSAALRSSEEVARALGR